jgi:hypothetical protein
MSATFKAAAKALSDNAELFAKVRNASSAEERAAHFKDASIAVPTHADVNSYMADIAGGQSGSSSPWLMPNGGGATAAAAAANDSY